MKNLNIIFKEILYISKLTKVNKKKFRILISAFLTNLTVGLDITIIIIFSNFFIDTSYENFFIAYFIENKQFLPLLILLRFIFVLLDKINIKYLQLKISQNLKEFLIKDIFERANYSVADATFYLTQLTDHVSYFYGAISIVLSSFFQLIIYLIFLSITDIRNITIFALVGAVIYIPTIYFLKKGRIYMDSTYKFGQEINRSTQRIIDNLFLIKILNTFTSELKNFSFNNQQFSISQIKNFLFGTVNSLTPNFLVTITISILIVFFGLAKTLTLEFIGIMLRLVQTLGVINNGLNMVINSKVHLEKLHLIDQESILYITNSKIEKKLTNTNKLITLEKVDFRFFGSKDLFFKNLNIEIDKEKHTIITGSNGSGKSTLIGLLSGVLKPLNGRVEINTNKIGYVGVKPLIVEGTLKQNLLYGNDLDVSDDEIYDVINKFKLFNESNKANLSMKINNQNLSSGQFQKIGYIRAILAKVELLILDESMSNLDSSTRKVVLDLLKELKITTINSTHNFNELDFDRRINITVEEDQRVVTYL